MQIIDSESGDFTRARGREVMKRFLEKHGREITAVFAQNDDMALGAIQAIEEYGLKPGVDIKIVSIDAARGAFEAMIAGKLNATVECNPLLGPQFFELALQGGKWRIGSQARLFSRKGFLSGQCCIRSFQLVNTDF